MGRPPVLLHGKLFLWVPIEVRGEEEVWFSLENYKTMTLLKLIVNIKAGSNCLKFGKIEPNLKSLV